MKRILILVLLLLTWYLAAMYRSLPLMALCTAELVLLVCLFVLPRHLRHSLTVRFSKPAEWTRAGAETDLRIVTENKGKLPVSGMSLRLRVFYPRKGKSMKRTLRGSCGTGEDHLDFQVRFPLCGPTLIRLERVRFRDYLSLFSCRKKLSEEMKVAVFPGEETLNLSGSGSLRSESPLEGEQTTGRRGENSHEIRQIREYRAGDSARGIHWNLSARTDEVWVREYEQETDMAVDVFADLAGVGTASLKDQSAFWTLLSALVLGLLRETAQVRVHWREADKQNPACGSVTDPRELRELLLRLYEAEYPEAKNRKGGTSNAGGTAPTGVYDFQVSLALELWSGSVLLHQFTRKNLEREIAEKTFFV